MRQIYCPKCGANTEYDPDTLQDLFLSCSQCGSMIPLMDSQVITIADGSMQGPGMRNLEEKEQDLVFQAGKAVPSTTTPSDSESIIVAQTAQSLTVKSPSLNPLQNSNLATVEEQVECKIDTQKNKPAAPPSAASRYSIKPSGSKPSQPGVAAPKKPKLHRKKSHRLLIWGIIILVIVDLLIVAAVFLARH